MKIPLKGLKRSWKEEGHYVTRTYGTNRSRRYLGTVILGPLLERDGSGDVKISLIPEGTVKVSWCRWTTVTTKCRLPRLPCPSTRLRWIGSSGQILHRLDKGWGQRTTTKCRWETSQSKKRRDWETFSYVTSCITKLGNKNTMYSFPFKGH